MRVLVYILLMLVFPFSKMLPAMKNERNVKIKAELKFTSSYPAVVGTVKTIVI